MNWERDKDGIRFEIAGGLNTVAPPDALKPGEYPISKQTFCRYNICMNMPDKCHDLTGVVFGRLTVVRWVSSRPTRWLCRCVCGNEKAVNVELLKHGKTTSCGCRRREVSGLRNLLHGYGCSTQRGRNPHPLYGVWCAMKRRCGNPHSLDFKNYGGRGITVCERWKKFENFRADMEGTYRKGFQIDRTDNDAGYFPSNCKWVSSRINARNRRMCRYVFFKGKKMCLTEACEIAGMRYKLVYKRITTYKWSFEKAISLPDPRRQE